jgi:hypothetical protein
LRNHQDCGTHSEEGNENEKNYLNIHSIIDCVIMSAHKIPNSRNVSKKFEQIFWRNPYEINTLEAAIPSR